MTEALRFITLDVCLYIYTVNSVVTVHRVEIYNLEFTLATLEPDFLWNCALPLSRTKSY
jgi:hypothetical protein